MDTAEDDLALAAARIELINARGALRLARDHVTELRETEDKSALLEDLDRTIADADMLGRWVLNHEYTRRGTR